MGNSNFKLVLNKKNLLHNIAYLTKIKNKNIIPVIKANAYGHGIIEIVDMLYLSGYREFVVAKLSEAEKIIKEKKYSEIKILIFESIKNLEEIRYNENIYISINSLVELKEALEFGISPSKMHIKVDIGYGRNGISYKDKNKILDLLKDKNNIKFGGVYSHLFAANYKDGLDIIEKFTDFIEKIGREKFDIIHLQNSAGIFNYDCEIVTHIRPGMLIYGLQESGYKDFNLRQVFELKGIVADIKSIDSNKYLAYETREGLEIKESSLIAKIKIGYGDGFLKKNERGKCLIKNKEFEIKQVTMDNSFILIDEKVKIGDEVILYYDIEKTVNHLDMGMQEILILINERIERKII